MEKKQYITVEVTDLFGGELNYSWVRRYSVKASTNLGAIRKVSRHEGLNFRYTGIYYKAQHCLIGATVDDESTEEPVEGNILL